MESNEVILGWPYTAASTVAVFLVLLVATKDGAIASMSRGKRMVVTFALIFSALVLLNLAWHPYGG